MTITARNEAAEEEVVEGYVTGIPVGVKAGNMPDEAVRFDHQNEDFVDFGNFFELGLWPQHRILFEGKTHERL